MSLTRTPAAPRPRPPLDDVPVLLDPAAVADLRGRVHGPVYVAGEDGLAAEVAAWNLAVTHTPAVAVGATCAADVAAAVSSATAQGLPVAVQATGHGPVRNADGALLITTRRMQGVSVDPVRRTARVEAGVTWQKVMAAAAEHGLAGPCGSSSGVGVVGYTLGGGLGPLGRAHGFAADAVVSVEMVTADGVLRTVRADTEPELFWAVRGGKGNFGVVTALEFELFPVPALVAGGLFFAGRDAAAVLHAYRTWAPALPEEVTTSIAVLRLPPLEELPPPLRGQTVVHLRYVYAGGDPALGAALVAPMESAGEVLLGGVGPMPTTALDAVHMDPTDPMPGWEKGMLLADLPAEAVDAFLAVAGPDVQVPLVMAEIRQMGGALARPARVPDAVPGRDAAWSVFVVGPMVPELAEVVPAVGRGVLAALEPWAASSRLVNFLGDVAGPDEVLAAWSPEAAERLLAVKRAVDPDDVFCTGYALRARRG
ncbi:FAD-binding oxidoreductase [Geodermatophilus amargosae]|uniref:FAD-binding oxidoreductase n=1 Tax=Geodermatophilus amargosae TaxID=1296565 RepID=UPI0034DE3945